MTQLKRGKKSQSTATQEPEWQKAQRRSKIKRIILSIGLILVSLLIVVISYKFWEFLDFLRSPFQQATGGFEKEYLWEGDGQITVLLLELEDVSQDDSEISFASLAFLNPQSSSLKFLKIPLNLNFFITGRGYQEFKDLYRFGFLKTPRQNIILPIKTLSENLGLPIDGYLLVDKEGLEKVNQDIGFEAQGEKFEEGYSRWHRSLFSLGNFFCLGQIKKDLNEELLTNLSPQEILKLLWELRRINLEEVSFFDLSSNLVEEKDLDGGQKIWVPNSFTFDDFAAKNFYDSQIKNERIKIEVLNSTEIAGMASNTARIIKNLGGEVIEVGNLDEPKNQTYLEVYSTEAKESYTVKRLAQILNCPIEDRFDKTHGRADVSLVIGTDRVK